MSASSGAGSQRRSHLLARVDAGWLVEAAAYLLAGSGLALFIYLAVSFATGGVA